MAYTVEEKKATIRALIEERRGYVMRGLDDRVAAVDAQLRRLGASAEKPVQRASQRPASRGTPVEVRSDAPRAESE